MNCAPCSPCVPCSPRARRGGPRGACRRERSRGGTSFVSEVFATDHGSQVAGHTSPVTGRRSRAAGRCISPLEFTLTKKCACKCFRMDSYKIIGLKRPWNDILTKNRGVGPSAPVANTRLKSHFPELSPYQLQIIGLKLESHTTKSYKRYLRELPSRVQWALPSGSQRRVSRPAQTSITTSERCWAIIVRYEALRKDAHQREPRS